VKSRCKGGGVDSICFFLLACLQLIHTPLLYFKTGTAAVGHTQGQAQQFRVKNAGVGAFHMRFSRAGRQISPIAQKTLFVPVSKGPVINVLKGCPNVSPLVSEQCLLAFSASSKHYQRFNSGSQSILVFCESELSLWIATSHSAHVVVCIGTFLLLARSACSSV